MNQQTEAMQFAMEKHAGQLRKYINEPYWGHLAEVAGIVAMTQQVSPLQLKVAWLHDTLEDTCTSYEDLYNLFGKEVACSVQALTDVEEGNRKQRKEQARKRLSDCSGSIQTIKYADGLSNLRSIAVHDKKFAKVYIQEWKDLLNVMNKGDTYLYATICREVKQSEIILDLED